MTSTEGFYAGISNSNLQFIPPSKDPPKIKDNVRERPAKHEQAAFRNKSSSV